MHKHIAALDQGDETARRQAIQALRRHEAQDWAVAPHGICQALVISLRHQLRDVAKPPLILKDVATILGNMGPHSKPAVPQLIALLQEGIPDPVRETAARALGKFGEEARAAVDPLLALCAGRNPLAVQAIRALGHIGCASQRVRTALIDLWRSPTQTPDSPMEIALALCRLGIDAEGLVSFLTHHLMASPENSLRKAAAEALGWRHKKDNDVVPALLAAAGHDKDEAVRQIAQASLDQLRLSQEAAIQLCAKQLDQSAFAETALRKIGAAAVPALIEALAAKEPAIRLRAARILGHLGEAAASAAPALAALLQANSPEIRLAAAKSLWNITKQSDAIVPVLIRLLEEKFPADTADAESRRRFVQTVIEALWRIGPPAKAAVAALTVKTKDHNRLIAESAQDALRRITSPPVK
jgi:HEAT repeat protein